MRTVMTALVGGLALATGCPPDGTPPAIDASAQRSAATARDFVQTPVGLVHATCLHQLAEGDAVDEHGNIHRASGATEMLTPCAYPDPLQERKRARADGGGAGPALQLATDPGWTETAYWDAPADVGYFLSTGRVPPPPAAHSGQLIYLFSALEDETQDNVILPALQWGFNGAFGGKHWGIASWYGGSYWRGHYYASAYQPVVTGDFVDGEMVGQPPADDCAGGCNWVVSTWTSRQQTMLEVRTLNGWRYAFDGAIEAYNAERCTAQPTDDDAENPYVQQWDASARWTPGWTPALWAARPPAVTCEQP